MTVTDLSQHTAVIFAGASGPPAQRDQINKNFFLLRGKPVVQYQVDLVRQLGCRRLVLVTEPSRLRALDLPEGTVTLEALERQSGNFATVKREVPFEPEERALVLFGDSPLMTPGVVHDFLARCAAEPSDFHHGLVPHVFAEPFMAFYPASRHGRRPFHLREFPARLGSMSLLRVAAYDPATTQRAVNTVMSGRKQDPDGGLLAVLVARARVLAGGVRFIGPLGAWMGVAAIVSHWLHERGFPVAARVTARPVTLPRLDRVAERLLGCSSRFLPCPFGGPSLDVDGEEDLEVLEAHLDSMRRLNGVQERLAGKLVEEAFDLSPECLRALERFDPEAAAEVRRHPVVVRQQRRILLALTPPSLRGGTNPAPGKASGAVGRG